MFKKIEELLNEKIIWKEEVPGGIVFHSKIDGELCQLCMNNYPEEPLYTVSWRDEKLDVDDKPSQWIFH